MSCKNYITELNISNDGAWFIPFVEKIRATCVKIKHIIKTPYLRFMVFIAWCILNNGLVNQEGNEIIKIFMNDKIMSCKNRKLYIY